MIREKKFKIPQKLKVTLLYYLTILLLGMYANDLKSAYKKDTSNPRFIASQAITAVIGDQSRCSPIDN